MDDEKIFQYFIIILFICAIIIIHNAYLREISAIKQEVLKLQKGIPETI